MPGDQFRAVLLWGGIGLVVLGLIVAGVAIGVVLAKRSRRGDAAPARLAEAFLHETPSAEASPAEPIAAPFVATAPPPPPAPPAIPAPPASGATWGDIIAAEHSSAEDAGYTTGSFAPPGQQILTETPTVSPRPDAQPQPIVAPRPAADLTTPPLVNPWSGTGPQPAPAGGSAPPPPPPPASDTRPPIAHPTATVPIERVPLAQPAAPPETADRAEGLEPFVAEPAPAFADPPVPSSAPGVLEDPARTADPGPAFIDPGPADEGDRTVLIGGRRRGPAPWLLILDNGDRIDIPAESVVLGRKTQAIEYGVPGITIPDGSKTLSKVHARIDRVGEQWTLTDLGSTNGCSVIEPGGKERVLPSGGSELIRGRFVLGELGMILVRHPEGPGA